MINTKTKKGFTLVELLVSIAIFSIIMIAVMDSFTGIFSSYGKARNLNKNLQNVQQAMNLVTKSIRTSSVLNCGSSCSGSPTQIKIYDYSQKKCIEYRFSGAIFQYRDASVADKEACETASLSAYKNLINGIISKGSFRVVPSVEDATVGKVTIMMEVTSGSDKQVDTVNIQSTLSLRDYVESKL